MGKESSKLTGKTNTLDKIEPIAIVAQNIESTANVLTFTFPDELGKLAI